MFGAGKEGSNKSKGVRFTAQRVACIRTRQEETSWTLLMGRSTRIYQGSSRVVSLLAGRVGSGRGDPYRPVRFQNLLIRDPTHPVGTRARPHPT